jgi:hypothetical protein
MRRAGTTVTLAAVAALAALASACKLEGKRQGHTKIGAEAAALREAFNADAGKVRVVVLVSPT